MSLAYLKGTLKKTLNETCHYIDCGDVLEVIVHSLPLYSFYK